MASNHSGSAVAESPTGTVLPPVAVHDAPGVLPRPAPSHLSSGLPDLTLPGLGLPDFSLPDFSLPQSAAPGYPTAFVSQAVPAGPAPAAGFPPVQRPADEPAPQAAAHPAPDAGDRLIARLLHDVHHGRATAAAERAAEEAAVLAEEAAAQAAVAAEEAAAQAAVRAREAASQKVRDDAARKKAEESARRQAEADAVVRAEQDRLVQLAASYVRPVTSYTLDAGFGGASSPWASCNTGQDFAVPTGTPAMAVHSGTITAAGWAGSYGYRVVLGLDDGTEVWYCNLSSMVKTAGRVVTGDVVGRVGATGNATGPQLHLEVRPSGGEPVCPLTWLREHGVAV